MTQGINLNGIQGVARERLSKFVVEASGLSTQNQVAAGSRLLQLVSHLFLNDKNCQPAKSSVADFAARRQVSKKRGETVGNKDWRP